MYDWQKVEGATLYPYRAVTSQDQRDVIDTGIDIPQWGRVYLCKGAARTVARLYGFSKGKEQERLSNAAEVVEALEKQVAEGNDERERLVSELKVLRHQHEEEQQKVEYLRGRVVQLEAAVSEEAKAKLALVGGDAA